jgi:transcriptional regulator with XRE-family HTH domain
MADETFGERLRRLRLARALSPGALAQRVGVTEGAIRQMESGQTKSASFPVGVRLAAALGVSSEFLALGTDATQPVSGADETALRLPEELGRTLARIEEQVKIAMNTAVEAKAIAVEAKEQPRPKGRKTA